MLGGPFWAPGRRQCGFPSSAHSCASLPASVVRQAAQRVSNVVFMSILQPGRHSIIMVSPGYRSSITRNVAHRTVPETPRQAPATSFPQPRWKLSSPMVRPGEACYAVIGAAFRWLPYSEPHFGACPAWSRS